MVTNTLGGSEVHFWIASFNIRLVSTRLEVTFCRNPGVHLRKGSNTFCPQTLITATVPSGIPFDLKSSCEIQTKLLESMATGGRNVKQILQQLSPTMDQFKSMSQAFDAEDDKDLKVVGCNYLTLWSMICFLEFLRVFIMERDGAGLRDDTH